MLGPETLRLVGNQPGRSFNQCLMVITRYPHHVIVTLGKFNLICFLSGTCISVSKLINLSGFLARALNTGYTLCLGVSNAVAR